MKQKKRIFSLLLALIMVLSLVPASAFAADRTTATIDSVRAAIQALSADPTEYTADDKDDVEAIVADFNSLSAEDQAVLDAECTHEGTGQSLGRVLESAYWAVSSFSTDASTTLADGTYTTSSEPAVSSSSDKGKSDSSRTRNWWVESVEVEDGQATAYIYVTGGAATASKLTSYPSVWIGGQTINRDSNNNYAIPVDLNGVTYFGGISSSMPTPIMYALTTELEEPAVPVETELAITNGTNMFKAVTASYVLNSDGSATLKMALSGTGYHYLYKGTYEQAVANGTAIENWIAGYENAAGKWEFIIPIDADEIGAFVPVVAVSNSYYTNYLNGQNSLERAFYPRQLKLDTTENKLYTGDYESTKTIVVTNNVSMFRPGPEAELITVGGPNSNNYSVNLVLPMTTTSMSNVFVGTPSEAEAAATTIAFDSEAKTFTIPVKWVDNGTLVSLCDGEPFVMSFQSASNGNWYGRQATLDEEAGTLVFDPWVDPAPANTVDELIAKIQVQYFTDTTWADCEAAKAAWDALSDAEKLLVEEYDYFGRDTGDASLDNPRNQDGIGEKEILVVSFGTSFNDSRVATIKAVEDAIEEEFGDEYSVRRAFTAQIIINHIYARDGEKLDNMKQALDRAVSNGVKELVIQPTHLMHGAEYDELVEALAEYADSFESIIISEPLLGKVGEDETVINEDKLAVAEAVVAAADVASDTALVLMGHGTAHEANITYTQMQAAMAQLGYTNVFVGTVEGEPEGTDAESILAAVKAAGFTKVVLRPLMVVAGDHANNDMADPDDEESWFSVFVADEAFSEDTVTCQIAGLGQIPAVQQIYIQHIKDALYGRMIDLTITNNTNMFKAVTAHAEVKDESITLVMALSGSGYHYLYKGTYEEAVENGAATENWIAGYTNDEGKWEFRIPITDEELGQVVPVVAVSQSYYEKYLNGQNPIQRAFYPRQLTLDLDEATLVTGDYEKTQTLAVTNNVSMFSVAETAALHTVGGPNSNNYGSDLILTMGSNSFSKAFIGTAEDAAAAAEADVIDLAADRTFTFNVRSIKTAGDPSTVESLIGEWFTISFFSVRKNIWYERAFRIDEEAGTLVIDPVVTAKIKASISVAGEVAIALKDVTARDLDYDGTVTADEALTAVHEAYFEGGAEAGYAVTNTGMVSRLWGVDTTAIMYWKNNEMCGGLSEEFKDGDVLYAYVFKDDTYWSDAYSKFDKFEYACLTGSQDVVLQKASYDSDYNMTFGGAEGAAITVYDSDLNAIAAEKYTVTENGEGNYSLTFLEEGEYIIIATDEAANIVPAIAAVSYAAATAKVDFTSQLGGAFLHAPQFGVSVASNLAETYGFTDDVADGVSALDVLVKAHELAFGEDFTPETAQEYMKVSYFNVTKQFGVDSDDYYGGFFVNHAFANDGTESSWGGYNGTVVGTQKVVDGDLVEFFFYEDELYGDTYNWFVDEDDVYGREFTVYEDEELALTLKGFYAMSSYLFIDADEMIASDSAYEVADAQIYTVDPETGALTAIEDAVTDEDGAVTLIFDEPGTYMIAAYGTEDCMFTQILSLTTITVKPVYTASVDFTSQLGGAFLHAPQFGVTVASNLAENYGFADDVADGVSALDVLVKAHELVYGEDFTPETAQEYMEVSYFNVTKQFGVDSDDYYGGFFVNHAFANDGTESSWGGYNGTVVGTQKVVDGDLVEFFFYEDELYGDTYNWFVDEDEVYSREFTAIAGEELALTLKGFYAMSSYLFIDADEMIASDSAYEVADAQIYTVDPETGALTAIEDAVTDEDGAVTLVFDEPGTYMIAAYGTEDCMFTQILSLTTVNVVPVSYIMSFNAELSGKLYFRAFTVPNELMLADQGAYFGVTYTDASSRANPVSKTDNKLIKNASTSTQADTGVVRRTFTSPFFIAQLHDEVTYKLYDSEGTQQPLRRLVDGVLVDVDDEVTSTPWDYLEGRIANSVNPNMVALAKAIENYGTAAQLYFDYNTDAIPEEALTALSEAVSDSSIETALEEYAAVQTGDLPAGISRYTASLFVESDHSLVYHFYLDGSVNISEYSFAIDYGDGKGFKTVTAEKEADDKYCIQVRNIASGELSKTYTFRVSCNGTTCTIDASALSYALGRVKNSTNPAMVDMAKALYLYSVAADAYF